VQVAFVIDQRRTCRAPTTPGDRACTCLIRCSRVVRFALRHRARPERADGAGDQRLAQRAVNLDITGRTCCMDTAGSSTQGSARIARATRRRRRERCGPHHRRQRAGRPATCACRRRPNRGAYQSCMSAYTNRMQQAGLIRPARPMRSWTARAQARQVGLREAGPANAVDGVGTIGADPDCVWVARERAVSSARHDLPLRPPAAHAPRRVLAPTHARARPHAPTT
jgi:hypothetical protein